MSEPAKTLAEIDFTDLDLFAHGFPHALFEIHRREAPVWWHAPTRHTPGGEGFWSVASYAETLEVLRDPVTYSSERGGTRQHGGTLLQDLPVAGVVLNMMDDPRHARIRALVRPTHVAQWCARPGAARRTRALPRASERRPVRLLVEVAAELPMQMICILRVPEGDRHMLFEAVESQFDIRGGDAGEMPPEVAAAHQRMFRYGAELIAAKRAQPTDDMLSTVVHATLEDVEPPSLSDGELYMFFSLLFAAGSETTRNAIAGGLWALIERPDQLAALRADLSLLPGAIEEMLRWMTPSPSKRRTLTRGDARRPRARAPEKMYGWEGSAKRTSHFARAVSSTSAAIKYAPAFGTACYARAISRARDAGEFESCSPRSAIRAHGARQWTRSNRHTGSAHAAVLGGDA